MSKTLYDKIWDDHMVHQQSDGTELVYVDRHLIHEVTSPQAFEGLRLNQVFLLFFCLILDSRKPVG